MWIKDEDFIRGEVPMTKFNIRSLIIAHLEIKPGDRVLDVGCGTGSISVEAASHGAIVTAIDKEDDAIELTRENSKKHGVDLKIVHGVAPESLEDEEYDKIFIGGSTGHLREIFEYAKKNLKSNGIIEASFILLKNVQEFKNLLKEYDYENIETHLVTTAKEDRIGLLRGENPIFIVKGYKK